MNDNKKSSLIFPIIIGIIIVAVIKNIMPAIAKLAITIIIVAGIVLILLVISLIISGLKQSNSENEKNDKSENNLDKTQQDKLSDARQKLAKLRVNLSKIDNEEIRRLFTNVFDIIDKIIKAIKEDKVDFQKARRVFNYYLDSISEIEEKYISLKEDNSISEINEKLKIHLNEIKIALEKLLCSLYEGEKLDLTVDMKALSIALKRDGLIDEKIENIPGDLEK